MNVVRESYAYLVTHIHTDTNGSLFPLRHWLINTIRDAYT